MTWNGFSFGAPVRATPEPAYININTCILYHISMEISQTQLDLKAPSATEYRSSMLVVIGKRVKYFDFVVALGAL